MSRLASRVSLAVSLAVLAVAMASPAAPQAAPDPAATASTQSLARNFDGVWSNASGTRLERPGNYRDLVVPKAEADAVIERTRAGVRAANTRSDPNAPVFADANSTAGYNSFWLDPGVGLMTVRGEARSSYITEPADGRAPFKDRMKSLATQMRDGREYQSGQGAYTDPEDLPLRERCLIAQTDGGGPVMLNGPYNNNYLFRLSKDYLVIEVEMVHDARIYPIYESAAKARASHKPSAIRPWLGDSVAWWEGDTLVAETRNVHPVQERRTTTPVSSEGVVQERFTRIAEGELLYQFRVEDSVHYTKPWGGEYSFKPTKGSMYEYACHEGNYSVPGILRGARMKEEEAAKAKAVKATKPAAKTPK